MMIPKPIKDDQKDLENKDEEVKQLKRPSF